MMGRGTSAGSGAAGLATRGGRAVVAAGVLIAAVACGGSPAELEVDPLLQVSTRGDLVFMTQRRDPSPGMEALFTGPVVADDAGCLRTGSADGAAVVWPLEWGLDVSGDVPRVVDEGGAVVGALGDEFVFAGGQVDVLLESMGFTDQDRAAAEVCPGPYWIVNDES